MLGSTVASGGALLTLSVAESFADAHNAQESSTREACRSMRMVAGRGRENGKERKESVA